MPCDQGRAFSKWGAPHCLLAPVRALDASHAVCQQTEAAIKTHCPPSLLSLLLSSSTHHLSSTYRPLPLSSVQHCRTSLALHLCLLNLSTPIHTLT